MKQTKKWFALLMALVLAFSLALPALAEAVPAEVDTAAEVTAADVDWDAVNWDDFYIITQPPKEVTVPYGGDFSLSVEVNIPAGLEVRYLWAWTYSDSSSSAQWGPEEPAFSCSPGDDHYPAAHTYKEWNREWRCLIIPVEKDSDGKVVQSNYEKALRTDITAVTLQPKRKETVLDTFLERFIFRPFMVSLGIIIGSFGLLIPLVPIFWILAIIHPDGLGF